MKSSRLTALLLAATAGAWGERRPSLLVLCFCFCFYPVKEKKNNPRVFKQKYKNIFLTLLLKYPWMGDKMYIIKDVHYKFPSPLGCRCPALSRTWYQRVVFVFVSRAINACGIVFSLFLLQRRKKVTTDSIFSEWVVFLDSCRLKRLPDHHLVVFLDWCRLKRPPDGDGHKYFSINECLNFILVWFHTQY